VVPGFQDCVCVVMRRDAHRFCGADNVMRVVQEKDRLRQLQEAKRAAKTKAAAARAAAKPAAGLYGSAAAAGGPALGSAAAAPGAAAPGAAQPPPRPGAVQVRNAISRSCCLTSTARRADIAVHAV